jgi:hypothetical protein
MGLVLVVWGERISHAMQRIKKASLSGEAICVDKREEEKT